MKKKFNFLKFIFFLLIVKPFILWFLGVNARNMERLPKNGPAIIVANHNSHLDTLIIMSLFSISKIMKIYPIAAEDYFCDTKFKEWFYKTLIGILPIKRKIGKLKKEELFKDINETIRDDNIVIIYPEGTRGLDNKLNEFKTGVSHLAAMNPNVPVIPLYINGTDKILPKIDAVLVPFIADIYVAEPLYYDGTPTKIFTDKIKKEVENLKNMHIRKENL